MSNDRPRQSLQTNDVNLDRVLARAPAPLRIVPRETRVIVHDAEPIGNAVANGLCRRLPSVVVEAARGDARQSDAMFIRCNLAPIDLAREKLGDKGRPTLSRRPLAELVPLFGCNDAGETGMPRPAVQRVSRADIETDLEGLAQLPSPSPLPDFFFLPPATWKSSA